MQSIHWQLALKRVLRPGAILMAIVIMIVVWAAGTVGDMTGLRPCGVVCEDTDAAQICDALVAKGFIKYDSRKEMTDAVSLGTLDCGAVLLKGLGKAAAAGNPSGYVLLLSAPDAFMMEAYEAHIAASLYTASAPALTQEAAKEAGVKLDRKAVEEKLEEMRTSGYRFTFDIVTTEGVAPKAPDIGKAAATAAAALLLFAAIIPGTIRISEETLRIMPRCGGDAAVRCILIPSLSIQALLYLIAAGIMAPYLIPDMIVYILMLNALGLILSRIPFRITVLLPIVLLGSLAMIPIYIDLGALVPQVRFLRFLLPPCWLQMLPTIPVLQLLAAVIVNAVLFVLYPERSPT